MFHPSMSKALAEERQSVRLAAAQNSRVARVIARGRVLPGSPPTNVNSYQSSEYSLRSIPKTSYATAISNCVVPLTTTSATS